MVIRRGLHYISLSPMCDTSAKGLKMKALVNNNLPNQTNDVIVNPVNRVNPDSKPSVRGKYHL